jgi:hypothetical protein
MCMWTLDRSSRDIVIVLVYSFQKKKKEWRAYWGPNIYSKIYKSFPYVKTWSRLLTTTELQTVQCCVNPTNFKLSATLLQ